jgi:hypothetical protein
MPLAAQECNLPPRDCTGTPAHCIELVAFEPVTGPGYDNYPINGETADNQYRSYARRELVMLVKYASAVVDCKAKDWTPGNGKPVGLGDMSERDGATPGTSIGEPAHPQGTHVLGRDMDIAYYQLSGDDNHLREVCPHTSFGKDAYRCTGDPDNLDLRRTALFIGTFLTSDRVRVIGVDGRIAPLLIPTIEKLCGDGVLPALSCERTEMIASETVNRGWGWYYFHHHHFHVSMLKTDPQVVAARVVDPDLTLAPGGDDLVREITRLGEQGIAGHAHVR